MVVIDFVMLKKTVLIASMYINDFMVMLNQDIAPLFKQ